MRENRNNAATRARDPEVGAFTPPLERNTEQTLTLFLHKNFLSVHIYALNKTQKSVKSKREKRETKQRDIYLEALFLLALISIVSVVLCALKRSRLLKVLKLFHFGQHDGRVGKFLRATRGV